MSLAKVNVKNETLKKLFNGNNIKGAEAVVAPLRKQCNWSKVLRFAPGLKIRPDELFEVKSAGAPRTVFVRWD